MKFEPLEYQKETLKQAIPILTQTRRVALSVFPGGGKTYMSLFMCGVLEELEKATEIIVVAPKILHKQWHDEYERFELTKLPLKTITYEALKKHAVPKEGTIYIFDEYHARLGNKKSKRTKTYTQLLRKNRNRIYRIYLSGTPFEKPIKLWPILLAEQIFDNSHFLHYITRFCGAYRGPFGWVYDGASNIPELRERLNNFMVFTDYELSVKDLPPMIQRTVVLGNSKFDPEKHGVNIHNVEKFLENPYDFIPFEDYSRVRAESAREKVEDIVSYMLDTEQPDKLVMFFHHIDVGEAIYSELKEKMEHGIYLVHGKNNGKVNNSRIESWKQSRKGILMLSLGVGSEGLNLAQYAHHMVFAEFPWQSAQLYQALKRLHRFGQEHPVIVTFLVKDKSFDKLILKVLLKKASTLEEFVGMNNMIFA